MREIEILGKHFSEKEDIQINFLENITPQTDGKKIFLPADMPRKVAPSVLAILMHESYHIKKESKVMEKEIKKLLNGSIEDSILHEILNIIEDVRIDREVFSDYMGAKGLYEEELRRLSGKKPPENPVAWAIACAIAEAEELDSSILPAPPKKVLPLKDEIVSILKKVPVKQKRGAKKKIKYIVEDLYDLLKNYFQKPPQPSSSTPTNPTKKKSEGGNDEGSKTGKGQTEEDTEIEKEENNKKSEEEQEQQEEKENPEDQTENSEGEEEEQQEKQEQQQEEENPEDQEEQGDEEQDQQQEENQGEKQQEAEKKIQEAIKEVQNNTIGIHQLERILQEEEKDDIRAVKISPAIAKRLLLAKIENT
ncbi:MAG TPA: hypothetical protein P5150_08745, partial [Candidatus Ratteibacteria bacterium]|nr:hypothetical protein [Candidatus Ratteibacteria bacterium]